MGQWTTLKNRGGVQDVLRSKGCSGDQIARWNKRTFCAARETNKKTIRGGKGTGLIEGVGRKGEKIGGAKHKASYDPWRAARKQGEELGEA